MTSYAQTPRTRLIRLPKRGHYDQDTVHAILDEALICHIGTQMKDRPMVQPTLHWRDGNRLYIHGSSKNGLFQALLDGAEACITVTLVDALVLARSAFHHSVNYRSVMIFAAARKVTDEAERMAAFKGFIEKVEPGRWDKVRAPNKQEDKATAVLCFDLTEVSAKVRTGCPIDDLEDYSIDVWAGLVPLKTVQGEPIKDTNTTPPA